MTTNDSFVRVFLKFLVFFLLGSTLLLLPFPTLRSGFDEGVGFDEGGFPTLKVGSTLLVLFRQTSRIGALQRQVEPSALLIAITSSSCSSCHHLSKRFHGTT